MKKLRAAVHDVYAKWDAYTSACKARDAALIAHDAAFEVCADAYETFEATKTAKAAAWETCDFAFEVCADAYCNLKLAIGNVIMLKRTN